MSGSEVLEQSRPPFDEKAFESSRPVVPEPMALGNYGAVLGEGTLGAAVEPSRLAEQITKTAEKINNLLPENRKFSVLGMAEFNFDVNKLFVTLQCTISDQTRDVLLARAQPESEAVLRRLTIGSSRIERLLASTREDVQVPREELSVLNQTLLLYKGAIQRQVEDFVAGCNADAEIAETVPEASEDKVAKIQNLAAQFETSEAALRETIERNEYTNVSSWNCLAEVICNASISQKSKQALLSSLLEKFPASRETFSYSKNELAETLSAIDRMAPVLMKEGAKLRSSVLSTLLVLDPLSEDVFLRVAQLPPSDATISRLGKILDLGESSFSSRGVMSEDLAVQVEQLKIKIFKQLAAWGAPVDARMEEFSSAHTPLRETVQELLTIGKVDGCIITPSPSELRKTSAFLSVLNSDKIAKAAAHDALSSPYERANITECLSVMTRLGVGKLDDLSQSARRLESALASIAKRGRGLVSELAKPLQERFEIQEANCDAAARLYDALAKAELFDPLFQAEARNTLSAVHEHALHPARKELKDAAMEYLTAAQSTSNNSFVGAVLNKWSLFMARTFK